MMKHDSHSFAPLTTLPDAACQPFVDDGAAAVIYVETGRPPVEISRRDFFRKARRYAHSLRALGIRPGELVVIAHEGTLEMAYCFWGLVLIGAIPSIYVTMNERLYPEVYMANLDGLIRSIEARALLIPDELAAAFTRKLGCAVHGFGELHADEPGPGDDSVPIQQAAASGIAYVQTSSGTTGSQRCIPTTHRMIMAQVDSLCKRMEVTSRDVIVNWMPLYHDGGLILGAILPLVRQVPVVLISPLDWVRHPAILFRAIADYRGTICNMPNFAFNHSARRVRERDLEGVSLSGMRAFVNGSERVYPTSFENFLERFSPLGVTRNQFGVAYGLAENTLMAAHTRIGQPLVYDSVDREKLENSQIAETVEPGDAKAVTHVSCGPPVEGVEIRIVDEGAARLPERHVGQVAIRGESLFNGYYRRPELSADSFREGWFLTGDRGYLADGELYIVGRQKDLIINGGKNIYPADIEETVNTIPGIRPGRVVAFGVPDEVEGTELIAIVAEVDTDDPARQAEIGRQIRLLLAQKASVTVNYVDVIADRWIIKTSSGKTSRSANRKKWLAEQKPKHPIR